MRTLEIFADIMNGVEEENKARWLARHSALCLSPVMVKLAQNTGFKNIASAKSPNALSMHEALGQLLKS
jgi:uroporphyrinogen-III synthase